MKTELLKARNYTPESIGFAEGFLIRPPKGGRFMVADWDKAKSIINDLIWGDRTVCQVEMGLDGDWGCNSMTVWEGGEFSEYDCFRGSLWAEPIILVIFEDGATDAYSVWKYEDQ